jgi:RES domain-containing protein
MLYAAAAFEGALLEQLVRAGLGRLARDRAASRIVIPDDLEIRVMDESDHPEWSREAVSRRMGEEWATSRASVAMVVPSVVARPWGRNVLINPAHEAFGRVEVAEVVEAVWDPRLA